MARASPLKRPSSPTALQIKVDFRSYWEKIEKSKIDNPDVQRSTIATAHKYAMCFSYLARAMATLSPYERIFFQELTSDAVHLVHALVNGDARGAKFYLRSVIENFWRHHYFRDHPVEYRWLHTRERYHLEMKNLREHCSWLFCFQGKMQPLMTALPNHYADLSSAVHSTSSRTLVLREKLDEIRLLETQGTLLNKDLLSVFKTCLTLCIRSEQVIFEGLHVNVQQFLLESLSARQRTALKEAMLEVEEAV